MFYARLNLVLLGSSRDLGKIQHLDPSFFFAPQKSQCLHLFRPNLVNVALNIRNTHCITHSLWCCFLPLSLWSTSLEVNHHKLSQQDITVGITFYQSTTVCPSQKKKIFLHIFTVNIVSGQPERQCSMILCMLCHKFSVYCLFKECIWGYQRSVQ